MSNYNKATNFAVKDTLTSGDPDKVVSGAEIDNEFNSIASAVTSKADKVAAATTDNFAALDANGNLKDSGESSGSISAEIEDAKPPAGTVLMFASQTAPNGYLECDGSNVSRSTFSDLFNAISTTFGSGDGSTTFTLPDLRGEFVRGWDNNRNVDSNRNFGSSQNQSTEDQFATFDNRGSQDFEIKFISTPSWQANQFAFDGDGDGSRGSSSTRTSGLEVNSLENNTETRPRNIALMYIIKT